MKPLQVWKVASPMEVTPGMASSPVKPLHAIEGVVADGLEVIGQGEGCEAAAGLESGLADGGYSIGNGERAGEAAAVLEA